MNYAPEMTILVHDRESESDMFVKRTKGVRVFHRISNQILDTNNLFVLTSLTELPEVANIVKMAEQQQHLRGLFVRINIDSSFVSHIFETAQIPLNRNVITHSSSDVLKRVLKAWQVGAQEELIAEASVVVNDLFVLDCAHNSWKIPFDTLPALVAIPVEERDNFELDEDGSYIYWPCVDIHLDMETLRSAVDPEWQEKTKAERLMYEKRFGEAIATVRKAHNLKQSDIPGVSERHIRRIEKGTHPKLDTLRKLAQAHEMSLNEYLEEVAKTVSQIKESTVTNV